MSKKPPPEPPPEDSLRTLADFAKRILQVPKAEVQDSKGSDGPKKIEEPCTET